MPANIPDMAAVDAMGKQFTHNVFENISKQSFKAAKGYAKKAGPPLPKTNQSVSHTVTRGAGTPNAPTNTLPAGSSKAPGGLGAGAAQRALPSGPTKAPQGGFATPHTAGATPYSNTGANRPALPAGKYRGIATPYSPPARVIPMSGNAALTNRVNPNVAFSHTTPAQTTTNRTAFNQPSTQPFHNNAPGMPAATPGNTPQVHSPTQFSSVQPKSYPQHMAPAGSSQQVLPNLSAAHSSPGKPQTFTVGSRNIKGGGIAAMGSQLEAGLNARPIGLPEKKRRV